MFSFFYLTIILYLYLQIMADTNTDTGDSRASIETMTYTDACTDDSFAGIQMITNTDAETDNPLAGIQVMADTDTETEEHFADKQMMADTNTDASNPLAGIQEINNELGSFLAKEMVRPGKHPEEVVEWRSQKCIKYTVHANTTRMISITDIEDMYQEQIRDKLRTTIPSQDILVHHAALPLSVTSADGMKRLKEEFAAVAQPREEQLANLGPDIQSELDNLANNKQTEHETAAKVVDLTLSTVSFGKKKENIKYNLVRQVLRIIQDETGTVRKQAILDALIQFLHRGIELTHLKKKSELGKLWGALNNRRGAIAENETAIALNQELQHLQGISLTGLKTHSCLSSTLDKLGITLTHRNEVDPETGEFWINEAETDYLSTWMEEGTYVVNMMQTKLLEERPWSTPGKAKLMEDTIAHALLCFKQLKKDMRSFKEIFPEFTPEDFSKIR